MRDARFDLDHTRITAPFTGRIGTHQVSIGNLIAGSRAGTSPTTLLAIIVSTDSVYLNFDTALTLTHNRVQDTLSRLPQEVQLQGVQVKKTIAALLLGVFPYSPDGSRSAEYISNYMILHVKDEIARLPGVADFWVLGERQYAMRIWIDPDKAAASDVSASDILTVLRAQNAQVSAGALNQPPVFSNTGGAYQINVRALGRLTTPEEFGSIIVKTDLQGRVTRIRDIGHVELGSADYGSKAYADHADSAPFWVIATPGADVVQVPHHGHAEPRGLNRILQSVFRRFNAGFERMSSKYAWITARFVRATALILVVYVGLISLTGFQFARMPEGFIPEQDIGYLVTVIQLPAGSSLARTDAVVREVNDIILKTPGIEHTSANVGFDVTTSRVAPNSATIFLGLPSLYGKHIPGVNAATMLAEVRKRLAVVKDAFVLVINPPPVQGLGSAGGFKLMVEDRNNAGPQALADATNTLVTAANKDPFGGVFTLYNAGSPSIYADIGREKAEKLQLTPTDVFSTLQLYLGSQYVNDFNYLGRTFQVLVEGDDAFRQTPDQIARLKVRNTSGEMVPVGSVAALHDETAPYRIPRYNLYPAADVLGAAAPGVASGTAMARMEVLAKQVLPAGFTIEWTELSHQQEQQGIPTIAIFAASALFVFLVLAAQYESWKLPLAIVLIVPMCLLASATGLDVRDMPIDILAQIGFVVLVGLAAKNAILIVEFARQRQDQDGDAHEEAATAAARIRLRPILMTSFAFILGVFPLAVATGAGAEMRQSLGTAVFFGMLGVTIFGLLFTPAFYTFIRKLGSRSARHDPETSNRQQDGVEQLHAPHRPGGLHSRSGIGE